MPKRYRCFFSRGQDFRLFFSLYFLYFLKFLKLALSAFGTRKKWMLVVNKSCPAWGKSERRIAYPSGNPDLPHDLDTQQHLTKTSLVHIPVMDGAYFLCVQVWLETPSIISQAAPAQVLWRHLPTPCLRRWGSCLMLWLHPSLSVCTCCIRWDTVQWLFPHPSRHTPPFPLHPASLKVQRTVIRDSPTAQVPPRAPSCITGDAARPGKTHLARI